MPNLTRLAEQSLRLDTHYVHPMCSPTRAALLSGRYASRFGCTGAQNERVFPFGTLTLASALTSRDYTTALSGKWHLGSLPEWGPNKFGFQSSYGSLAGGAGPYDHLYKTGPYSRTWQRDGKLIDEQGHITVLIGREAVRLLEQKHTAPFFLYVPFTAVHIPIKEEAKWLDMNAHIADPGDRLRAATASHMDAMVGDILKALDASGQRQNTIVLFLSDNGDHGPASNADPKYPHPEQYPQVKVGAGNAPLRGLKSSLYEGGIRSPAIISWPGKLAPGINNTPTHVADWMPTFTALAGFDPPTDARWDGMNIWPLLSGEAKLASERSIYGLGSRRREQMLRRGAWKLMLMPPKGVELFNLEKDPGEEHNVAADHPQLVAELTSGLKAIAERDNDSKVARTP